MRSGLITALALTILLPGIVGAQTLDSSATSADPFSVSVNPQYPAPGSSATLVPTSSTLDLANATMTASIGGKEFYRGSVQPVTVTLGKTGSVTTVLVTLASNGSTYRQTIVIQPEDVSVIAEPLSSAPVLYPGKPLVPLGGSTRVVAIANFKDAAGKPLDPSTLSYSWTVDTTQIANSSGIGKQAIVVASPLQYRTRTVSVVVTNQSGALVGGGSLSLNPTGPTVRIYDNDPLLGLRFDHALGGAYAITQSEDSLYAAPFSLPTTIGATAINWFLNGAPAQTGNLITLRPTGSGTGSASLSLTAAAGASTVATASLSLTFGAKQSTNFFGL